jgi:hypothetical protein
MDKFFSFTVLFDSGIRVNDQALRGGSHMIISSFLFLILRMMKRSIYMINYETNCI